jgi:putative SOS response-associated peptidase YedK
MCNLYSITTNQAAIIALFRVMNRYVGNLPPMPGVFPDYPAPVVRNVGTDRELTMMRWGMPPPPVTNIRNTSSPHWRGWLKPENRCLVPANGFLSTRRSQTLRPRKRTSFGLRSVKTGRYSPLPASGPSSKATAGSGSV